MPILSLWLALGFGSLAATPEPPRSLDPGLTVELIAAEPDLVTPTGLAVDAKGRVLVIESHSHFRPENYQGPPADRIRVFEDRDGDGRFETVSTFFEGTHYTMSLAVERDGSVLVATRSEIVRLRRDDEGKVVGRDPLARLETEGNYPHNGLSGFAIEPNGPIVFGLGENLGASYRLVAADGKSLTGGGEGGNVYRIRPDGSGLTRLATGFWNPFHQAFDPFGRLFVVDNDPDSRPPCRLLHVVEGGDYGFRFRNGRRGLHPFTAWNGELPGTLPMTAGTGEAPCAVVAYESDGLPSCQGQILVTTWGDHRIDRYRLEPSGASFQAKSEPLIVGGHHFRPVGLAVAPDGSLFFTDWVERSYTLHGKGRLWHVRSRTARSRPTPERSNNPLDDPDRSRRDRAARALAATEPGRATLRATLIAHRLDPRARASALEALIGEGPDPDSEPALRAAIDDPSPDLRALAVRRLPGRLLDLPRLAESDKSPEVRAEALRRLDDPKGLPAIRKALASDDPFLRQAAREGLKRSASIDELLALARDDQPAQRLGALLVLRERTEPEASTPLPALLADPDPTVRLAAVQWVAESKLDRFRKPLEAGMTAGVVSEPLFRSYLAALQALDGNGGSLENEVPNQAYVTSLALDASKPVALRRHAIRSLASDLPTATVDRLRALLDDADPTLRLEAVRVLRHRTGSDDLATIAALAKDPKAPEAVRAEAVAGLADVAANHQPLLIDLAKTAPRSLQRQAARSLRGIDLDEQTRQALTQNGLGALQAPDREPKPPTPELAEAILSSTGDPAEGERIFFHPKGPGCFRCHQVDGRGAQIGPDLSTIGRSTDPRKLVESILEPSREIAPQFVLWQVARADGTIASGVMLWERGGAQIYADSQGRIFPIKLEEVEERTPLPNSVMPENLVKALTVEELRDLVAYLRDPSQAEPASRTGDPPKAGVHER